MLFMPLRRCVVCATPPDLSSRIILFRASRAFSLWLSYFFPSVPLSLFPYYSSRSHVRMPIRVFPSFIPPFTVSFSICSTGFLLPLIFYACTYRFLPSSSLALTRLHVSTGAGLRPTRFRLCTRLWRFLLPRSTILLSARALESRALYNPLSAGCKHEKSLSNTFVRSVLRLESFPPRQ